MILIQPTIMKKTRVLFISLIVAQLAASPILAQESESWADQGIQLRIQASPFTLHFSPKTDHKNVVMVGMEREHKNGKLDGFTLFSNSFGQESVFIYPWGQVYHDIWDVNKLSFKWTAGLLYGYKAPYENKVPLNHNGFSPGVIAALAYEFKPGWSAQLDLLGTAGLMFQINRSLN